ncbi:hypothetical protein OAA99_03020 [Omnitrophica bacterium]|nr:hypothetical protein [Candidatus Omnitrophota bacterium]
MYVYNFKPKQKGINFKEIFVVMPFENKYDNIFDHLIQPATKRANELGDYSGNHELCAYRTKDDIRTSSGWINVLEHLLTARIVLGVLTDSNPNVFYELGIAHATQPITRQILIANKGYMPSFDLKDLIYYEYEDRFKDSIEQLAIKIKDAIEWYKIDEEKKIHQAKMLIGPYDFEVIMIRGKNRSFAIHTTTGREDYEKQNGEGSFERHTAAMTNLCKIGLLGLDTSHKPMEDKKGVTVYFSYHWTNLGNCVLHLMGLINEDEMRARREVLPHYFE